MTENEKKYKAIQKMIFENKNEDAITALEQFLSECDSYSAAHFDMGNLLYTAGRMDEALFHYQKTVSLEPNNQIYMKNLADLLYTEQKDVDQAIRLYEEILSLNPEDIQTLMIMGHLCVSIERFSDALDYYNRILDIEPWNGEAQEFVDKLMEKSLSFGAQTKPDKIYQHCQELVKRGKIDGAIAGYEELISLFPDLALAYNDLGVLYYQQGDKIRCLKSYEQAVTLDPKNQNYQKNLADFYLAEQGEIEKALKLYLSVLNENPEDIDTLMVAGHICVAIGNSEAARTFYDRVLDVEPWNLEASERLESLPG
jgi:tetratricopeptide (TPR) repeat protein